MKEILSNLEHILSRLEHSPALDDSLRSDIAALREEARLLRRPDSAVPVAGTLTILRWEGDRAYLSGWLTRQSDDAGAGETLQLPGEPLEMIQPAGTEEIACGSAVSIRTFGYFDVFVEGRPIAFRSQKSKELFALLVDRRGGFVSSEEAISFLWEDEPVSSITLARYRKVALRLKNILAEYGISDVVESVDGKRRIVPELVRCDLYDYLSGREEHAQLFKGSYLSNYSWGETTLAELTGSFY